MTVQELEQQERNLENTTVYSIYGILILHLGAVGILAFLYYL